MKLPFSLHKIYYIEIATKNKKGKKFVDTFILTTTTLKDFLFPISKKELEKYAKEMLHGELLNFERISIQKAEEILKSKNKKKKGK